MQRQSNAYTFLYITAMAFTAALVLSVTSQALRSFQERNAELEIKKNILSAVGLLDGRECDIETCYSEKIKSLVVNGQGVPIESSIPAEKIDFENELNKDEKDRQLPVFLRIEDGEVAGYGFPVVGKGLWSTMYGYIALESDLNTVKGITFYQHGETPGLGAEIETEWFQNNFSGKKIFNDSGDLVSIKVVKGTVRDNSSTAIHEVDGISGATLTADGVTKLLKKSLQVYEPYIVSIKKGM